MRQALHIFRKDSRQFRNLILLLGFWTMAFVAASARPWPTAPRQLFDWTDRVQVIVLDLSSFALPVAWWIVVACLFHAEALPGDRQFWLTRPYDRRSLFTAKALFVLAYISLPTAIAQAASLALHGLPLVPHLPGLLWEQVLILSILVLPAAALAVLTSTLTQFVIAVLIAPVLWMTYSVLPSWGGFGWIRDTVAIAAIAGIAVLVLFRQFRYRRTAGARRIALAALLCGILMVAALPWPAAFSLQAHLAGAGGTAPRASLELPVVSVVPLSPAFGARPDRRVQLRFLLEGVPEGVPVICEDMEVSIESQDGRRWPNAPKGGGLYSTAPYSCLAEVSVPTAFFEGVEDPQVRVRAVLYLTLFGPEQSTPLAVGAAPVHVPGVGLCAAVADQELGFVTCRTAFRETRTISTGTARPSYSPFAADLRIQPVLSGGGLFLKEHLTTAVTSHAPVQHVRVVVDERDVILRDSASQ